MFIAFKSETTKKLLRAKNDQIMRSQRKREKRQRERRPNREAKHHI